LWKRWKFPYSVKTMSIRALRGNGPPFFYIGRFPMYPKSELDKWMMGRAGPLVRSTAEHFEHKRQQKNKAEAAAAQVQPAPAVQATKPRRPRKKKRRAVDPNQLDLVEWLQSQQPMKQSLELEAA